VKIRSVTYDATDGTAIIKLARPYPDNPYRTRLQLTLHAGIMGTNGTSTVGDATTIFGDASIH
jgi:hypothetical protein